MRLFLVRHGQSEANTRNEFSNRGFAHPLTEMGIGQSIRVADELRGIRFKKVFSSPVLRAMQTAAIIAARNGIPSFEVNEALREYDVGTLEGKSDEASWKIFFDMLEDWEREENRDRRYYGGESFNDIVRRLARFVDGILASDCDDADDFLLVAHAGLFSVAVPALTDNLGFTFTRKNFLDNSGRVVLERRNGSFRCLEWGKTAFR